MLFRPVLTFESNLDLELFVWIAPGSGLYFWVWTWTRGWPPKNRAFIKSKNFKTGRKHNASSWLTKSWWEKCCCNILCTKYTSTTRRKKKNNFVLQFYLNGHSSHVFYSWPKCWDKPKMHYHQIWSFYTFLFSRYCSWKLPILVLLQCCHFVSIA